jgi:uncharacterized membrane protein (UPF0127 family)
MKKTIYVVSTAAFLVVFGFWIWSGLIAPSAVPSPPVAQARLPTKKLWIGSQELVSEIARRRLELETGLMFRTNLAPNEAMLFLLPFPQQAQFYMKNTLIPLSCAYINGEGIILEVHEMKPKDENLIRSATDNIQFVLEVNQGWFGKNHLGPGTLIRTETGPLSALLKNEN